MDFKFKNYYMQMLSMFQVNTLVLEVFPNDFKNTKVSQDTWYNVF